MELAQLRHAGLLQVLQLSYWIGPAPQRSGYPHGPTQDRRCRLVRSSDFLDQSAANKTRKSARTASIRTTRQYRHGAVRSKEIHGQIKRQEQSSDRGEHQSTLAAA